MFNYMFYMIYIYIETTGKQKSVLIVQNINQAQARQRPAPKVIVPQVNIMSYLVQNQEENNQAPNQQQQQ